MSIVLKVFYVMIIWKYLLECSSILWMLISIFGVLTITLFSYSVKELIMVSSIIQYILYLLGSFSMESLVYILFYILSNALFVSSLISKNINLMLLNVLNLLGIRRLLGFFIKLNYYRVLFGSVLVILCVMILLVYIINSYMYIRWLYILLCNGNIGRYLGSTIWIGYVLICMN